MGDLETLRLAQAAVGACVVTLVFFGTYGPTRASFAAWWGAAVGASALGTVIYMLLATSAIAVAEVAAWGVSVLGAGFVWMAARSLRGLPTRWWYYTGPAVACALFTAWGHSQGSSTAGTAAMLFGMSAMLGLSTWELVAVYRTPAGRMERRHHGEAHTSIAALAITSAFASAFYALRWVTLLAIGPEAEFYVKWAGPHTTTFLVMLMLVVVSYTVTSLSHYQVERGWRNRALTDDLTGLLQRSAFLDRAQSIMRDRADHRAGPAVIVADIDYFKDVNDLHGHAYGDVVLIGFSEALQAILGDADLAARFGGEEFVVFLADADVDRAIAMTDAINHIFIGTADPDRLVPTVSYGVAGVEHHTRLEEAIHLADSAMYRAKRAGRARTVAHEHEDS